MTLNHNKYKYIFTNESLSINKNIQSSSRNLPQCSPYWGYLLHGKSLPVPPCPNETHGHSDRQDPLGTLGVDDQSGV